MLKIINYYKEADVILFVGGGILRTTKGIKNSYVFLLILATYAYSSLWGKKRIHTPFSFGPFYYAWQYQITTAIINKIDIIAFREKYSSRLFKKYSNKKTYTSSDFALFLNNRHLQQPKNKFIIGFTIRNYFNKKTQTHLEKSYAKALYGLSQEINIEIQPLIQVDIRNNTMDNDFAATKNVLKYLHKYGVKTYKEVFVGNLDSAVAAYSSIHLLLGMRMHSNIIAASQGIPFVAVSYEHKTEGISQELGVEDYCVRAEDVNEDKLFRLLMKAYKNRDILKKTIIKSLKKIQANEKKLWRNILQSSVMTIKEDYV